MTGCWARRWSPDQHTCTAYACACDTECGLTPTNDLGLCDRHASDLLPPKGLHAPRSERPRERENTPGP